MKNENNITVINIGNIIVSGRHGYNNGAFVPVFLDELYGISTNKNITDKAVRLLIFLIAKIEKDNLVDVRVNDIIAETDMSKSCAYRCLKQLIAMRLLCRGESNTYHLPQYKRLISPRIAYYGNTRKIHKEKVPELLDPKTLLPLVRKPNEWTPFFDDDDCDYDCEG